jgi:hypothetical protein
VGFLTSTVLVDLTEITAASEVLTGSFGPKDKDRTPRAVLRSDNRKCGREEGSE